MAEIAGAWLIVGNVGGIRGGTDGPGTKHFSHGAKVYVCLRSRGDVDSVPVVGRHRGGGRLVAVWMMGKRIVNLRVKLVRDPGVMDKVNATFGAWSSEEAAREFMAQMREAYG